MYAKIGSWLAVFLLCLLSACAIFEDDTDHTSPEQIRIYATQTALARSGAATPTATLPPPTATTQAASPTATQPAVDELAYIADVSIPDGTIVPAGASFIKTWRIKNSGQSIWDTNYALVFISGSSMSGQATNPLEVSAVRPGEELEVSVRLVAPTTPGKYKGYWTLRSGRNGKDFSQTLYVEIEVVKVSTDPNNFAARMCSAEWRSDGTLIPCFGSSSTAGGYVAYTEAPQLEGGAVDDEPSLIVGLGGQTGNSLTGSYPAVNVPSGSRLRGVFGCYHEATTCHARLIITYRINNGQELTMGEWEEAYDGTITKIDVDLNAAGMANQQVQFIFTFRAEGSSAQNKVFFLSPRLSNP